MGKIDSGYELHNVANSAAYYQYMGSMSYLFLTHSLPKSTIVDLIIHA
jgi:hypothetical protein